MKKFMLLAMIALGALGMIGCAAEDETKADVKWTNNDSLALKDIVWASSGKVDQTWSGTLPATQATGFKGITKLVGDGDCVFDDGSPASITLDGASTGVVTTSGSSATIQENAAANLIIQSAK